MFQKYNRGRQLIKTLFNVVEIILYLLLSFILSVLYLGKWFNMLSLYFSRYLATLGPSKFGLLLGVTTFTKEMGGVVAIFLCGLFIGLGRKNRGSFYGRYIALGYYVIYIPTMIFLFGTGPHSLYKNPIRNEVYLILILVYIFIVLLSVLAGWLGGKLGGKIFLKSYLLTIGIMICLFSLGGSLFFKYLLWMFLASGIFIIIKSTQWFQLDGCCCVKAE